MLFHSRRFNLGRQDPCPIDISEDAGIRKLHFGGDDTQSAMRISDPTELVLVYSRCMFGLLLFADIPQDIVLIGLGGGSIPKWIHAKLPNTRTICVELQEQVIRVARSMFYLPEDDARLQVVQGDGAAYVNAMSDPVDVLMLDAYTATGIAAPLATTDFFASCRDHLTENGILAVNLWGSDRHFNQYCERLGTVFDGRILLLPARQKGNIVAFAFHRPQPNMTWDALAKRAQKLEAEYGLEFTEFVSDLARLNPHNDRRLFV